MSAIGNLYNIQVTSWFPSFSFSAGGDPPSNRGLLTNVSFEDCGSNLRLFTELPFTCPFTSHPRAWIHQPSANFRTTQLLSILWANARSGRKPIVVYSTELGDWPHGCRTTARSSIAVENPGPDSSFQCTSRYMFGRRNRSFILISLA